MDEANEEEEEEAEEREEKKEIASSGTYEEIRGRERLYGTVKRGSVHGEEEQREDGEDMGEEDEEEDEKLEAEAEEVENTERGEIIASNVVTVRFDTIISLHELATSVGNGRIGAVVPCMYVK